MKPFLYVGSPRCQRIPQPLAYEVRPYLSRTNPDAIENGCYREWINRFPCHAASTVPMVSLTSCPGYLLHIEYQISYLIFTMSVHGHAMIGRVAGCPVRRIFLHRDLAKLNVLLDARPQLGESNGRWVQDDWGRDGFAATRPLACAGAPGWRIRRGVVRGSLVPRRKRSI